VPSFFRHGHDAYAHISVAVKERRGEEKEEEEENEE
jgi:hypothetical protein